MKCKCEHWQECPTCMPHRFDADGKLKPPELTPLQACRAELAALRAAQAVTALEGERAVLLGLLTDCAAVLRKIDPDDSDEAEKLAVLLSAIDRAQAPSRHQGALL